MDLSLQHKHFPYHPLRIQFGLFLLPQYLPSTKKSTMAADAKAQVELKDFENIFSLKGKVAVVTGGSRGLGLHAASGYVSLIFPPSAMTLLVADF